MSDWLTVREVAEVLRVSRTTVHNWIAAGRLTARWFGPRTLRVSRADLDRLLSE